MSVKSKGERFEMFIRRLQAAPAAWDARQAFQLLSETLNAVEDEFTDIPFNPQQWMSDGRMYPPQDDSKRSVPGRPDLTRYRSRRHNTWIGDNGAILIKGEDGQCYLNKPGADGNPIVL